MSSDSDFITRLRLFQELAKSAGRDELDRGEVEGLCGLVTTTVEAVGPALVRIAQTFRQYTAHDIPHRLRLG